MAIHYTKLEFKHSHMSHNLAVVKTLPQPKINVLIKIAVLVKNKFWLKLEICAKIGNFWDDFDKNILLLHFGSLPVFNGRFYPGGDMLMYIKLI